AEDGIRWFHVTGVQPCALPFSWWVGWRGRGGGRACVSGVGAGWVAAVAGASGAVGESGPLQWPAGAAAGCGCDEDRGAAGGSSGERNRRGEGRRGWNG